MQQLRVKPLRLPLTLDLLPGLRWQGKVKVWPKENGQYLCEFNAFAPKAEQGACYIMDVGRLTPEQLKDWTGFSEET